MSDDLSKALAAAEQAMARRMREHMGSAEEQHQRIEDMIEVLGGRNATGIDRTASPWWRTVK